VLIHWNTEKGLDEIVHVYMRGAEILRKDLYPDHRVYVKNGEDETK
jgi:chorismate mutase